jgi:amidophosphoribosyltransferase
MCGIFAIKSLNEENIFTKLYWGILAQNHRGHDSYGFLTFHNGFKRFTGIGLVPKIEKEDFQKWKALLPGNTGIAHVRYGTFGSRDLSFKLKAAQPIITSRNNKELGIAYNGNLVNINGNTPDTEFISNYILEKNDIIDGIQNFMNNIEGAYSVVGLDPEGNLFAFRDPLGIRPLLFGEDNSIRAFSSESVGFNINDIKSFKEVEPGELYIIKKDSYERIKLVKRNRRAFCGFEFAYFSRPDSIINGKYVYEIREELGRRLGKRYQEFVRKSDLIISIPETADDAAYGLHEETGLKWERMIRRHRFVTNRAFIMEPDERISTISKKINVLNHGLQGKKVIVIEDSIVRGDTTRTVLRRLREAGAEKIYVFVTFPKITHPCFYGIDMATFSELIGFSFNEEQIAKIVGADAVCYQTIDDFINAVGMKRNELCMACTTGEYPTELAQKIVDKVKMSSEVLSNKRIYERLYK